jgi:hypothetical protein
MLLLILLAWASSVSPAQNPAPATPVDVSRLTLGPPEAVVELDLGTLKGELRQIGWSADDTQLYIQTAEGDGPSAKLHHYIVPPGGGAIAGLDTAPAWAAAYWAFKSDRAAPGIGDLLIDLDRKAETVTAGTGQAGALDREASPLGGNVGNLDTIAKGNDQKHKQTVFRLVLLGEAISEFVNERPIPGLMFSWGPSGSGAIAYTDRDGRLMLLDQTKHKRTVPGVKNAVLPAWTTSGSRLAWVQKTGRRKYMLMTATVTP